MRKSRTAMTLLSCLFLLASTAAAQEIGGFILKKDQPDRYFTDRPSPPTPRMPDGHVNFGRTEPGKGNWWPRQIVNYEWVLSDPKDGIPYQPWARAMREYREKINLQADDPEGFCLPPGGPRMMTTFFSMEMINLPDRELFIFEGAAHVWRTVYMDGRPHPPAAELKDFGTWLGHSVGHWEGDSLVVDSVGFNEGTWIDAWGDPHTNQMHLIEKFGRPNLMTLHYEATIDDPGAYTRPWTIDWDIAWIPNGQIKEYICQENNRWQENYLKANKLASGTGTVGADMGQGHPVKGVWLGDWGTNKQKRDDIIMTMDWDGKAISGTINPGKDEIVFQNGSMNPVNPDNWTVHLEGKSAKGLLYTLDGKIEHLTWGTRSIVGTWTQGNTKGDFKIQRQR